MAGYVNMVDGDSFGFHVGTFPNIQPGRVCEIQLDCDELERGLRIWPEADFWADPGRVRNWYGPSARLFAQKLLEHQLRSVKS